MKRLLSLSLSLILLSACSESTPTKTKEGKYSRVKNEYWKNCKYKDVIKEVLTQRLEYRLNKSKMTIEDISKSFKDKYDPEYTSTVVLQTLEVEIGQFISSLAKREEDNDVNTDKVEKKESISIDSIKNDSIIVDIKLN